MTIRTLSLAAALGLAMTLPAAAQGMSHSGHDMAAMGDADGAMPALMGTMDDMMSAMGGMASTGNPDADFLMMMIPHHQSALDMAQVELDHGKDAETLALARAIVDAQEKEIAAMKAMLKQMGFDAPE
ncbi:DUF305 domain-containing protein [Frigidibacter sp. MR17.24]|uniref:DUF305 domain-containing protein n=1 Tax=Frigidibacter sp. MR17.24 TaxID=3127345 RepID=UPI003012A309